LSGLFLSSKNRTGTCPESLGEEPGQMKVASNG
jgi:hypothetical protein